MRLQLFFAKTYFLFRNLCYTACSLHEIHAEEPRRDVRAGRRSTIGNRVYAKSVSGVRIPISPPEITTPLQAAFFFIRVLNHTKAVEPTECFT